MNVNEGKRAKRGVNKAEEGVDAIIRSALDAVVSMDSQGLITGWNERAEATFGWSKDDAIGRRMSETIIPPQHREAHERGLRHFLKTGEGPILNKRIEITALHRDGHEFPVELAISPLRTGRTYTFSAFIRDIGQRKWAEQRAAVEYVTTRTLADSCCLEDAIPRILESVCEVLGAEHGVLWLIDRTENRLRHIKSWTAPALALREFETASQNSPMEAGAGLPGRVWASRQPAWILDVGQDTNFPRAAAAIRVGLHSAFGFPILLGNEVLGVMEFFSRQKRQPDDDLLRTLAIIGSQIGQFSERKRAEAELRESKTCLAGIIDTALDAVITMDGDGRITGWNPQAENTFGWSQAEVLGRRLSGAIIPFQHREAHDRGLKHFLAMGQGPVLNKRIEITALHHDGREFPVELAISVAKVGEKHTFSAFIRDITGRKQRQEALEQSRDELEGRVRERTAELATAKDAAEAASRAKSEFLANMSHEIRTPMNGIIGMTELALDTTLTDEQRQYLNMVKTSADSLLTVINDILDFSKIEAERLDLDAIDFNLRDSLEETAQTLGPKAHEKGLELVCDVQPGVPGIVRGDPARLRQIVVNLAGNAIKFTERGEVALRVETESESESGSVLHFAVSDTGIGIPEEKQKLIFDPFSQADASTTRRYGGTGLGLTISSRLVRLMRGRIWVESEDGQGSTFHFTAQFDAPVSLSAEQASALPADLEGLPVLVVDDNPTNCRILQEALAGWGMKPSVADSAKAALEAIFRAAARSEPFRIVLTDAHMPVMDGFALAGKIQNNRELRETMPMIMMLTSAGRRGDAARCRSLGVAAYLTKPVRKSELREAILKVAGKVDRETRVPALVTRHSLREEKKSLRVLLAEDNAVNQRLAKRLLEKIGHRVEIAGNGREALAALDKSQFDVVLMDVQMPEMGGLEATTAIRERERMTGAHLPIIAMTARAMTGDREVCLAGGMDDYVSKPVQSKLLLEAIERLTSGK